jgi:hypothetical protein
MLEAGVSGVVVAPVRRDLSGLSVLVTQWVEGERGKRAVSARKSPEQ